jgi:hypothetical protein
MATDMHSFYTTSSSSHGSSHSRPIVDELLSKYSSTMTMTTSSPPRSASHRRSLLTCCLDRVRLEYYRYEVTFGVYVMTPGEKFVANTFVLVFLSLLIWASLLYLPQLLFQKLGRGLWLVTGHSNHVGVILSVLDGGYQAPAASIRANASLAM